MQKGADLKPATPPSAAGLWKPRRLRPVAGPLVQTLDLLLLSAAYLAIVLLPSMRRVHGLTAGMLQLSVSLRAVFLAALCLCTWRVILSSVGLYAPRRTRSMRDYLLRCLIGLNSCALVAGLIGVVLHLPGNVWHVVELFWLLSLSAMAVVRLALLAHAGQVRPRLRRQKTLIVVGSGQRAQQACTELETNAEWDYRLLGFVDSEPQGGFVHPNMILGGIDDLERILTATPVDEVMIALPMKSQYEAVGYCIAVCQMMKIQSRYFSDPIVARPHGAASPSGAPAPHAHKLVEFRVERKPTDSPPEP